MGWMELDGIHCHWAKKRYGKEGMGEGKGWKGREGTILRVTRAFPSDNVLSLERLEKECVAGINGNVAQRASITEYDAFSST
jgi:hypothetical protein